MIIVVKTQIEVPTQFIINFYLLQESLRHGRMQTYYDNDDLKSPAGSSILLNSYVRPMMNLLKVYNSDKRNDDKVCGVHSLYLGSLIINYILH